MSRKHVLIIGTSAWLLPLLYNFDWLLAPSFYSELFLKLSPVISLGEKQSEFETSCHDTQFLL